MTERSIIESPRSGSLRHRFKIVKRWHCDSLPAGGRKARQTK
jgi:hypothetical protein